MFGLLKNKLSGFIKNLVGKEEAKAPAPEEKKPPVEALKEETQPEIKKPEHIPKQEEHKPEVKKEAPAPKSKQETKPFAPPIRKEEPKTWAPKQVPIQTAPPKTMPVQAIPQKPHEEPKFEAPKPVPVQAIPPKPAPVQAAQKAFDLSSLEKKASSEHRGMAPKIGIGTAIKSFFSNEITIGESEVNDLLDELELSLLESDVAYDVSLQVTQQLRGKLVGMKVPKGEVEKRTKEAIQGILESVMESDRKFDFLSRVKSLEKPVKILFVGPNGAGKTTSIAKIARMLMDNGMTVVFSASDTFRAAAIEQTEVHGDRLGVKVIKSKYGADPASVAFDAVNHARSNNVDVVLIDSAGRQDTNANLLSELKKINRVAKPDIKLYVGESIGGNALLEQIKAFNEAIGIDGAILTKIDCDAKGGTAISISRSTGIPIIFLGIGQRYEDLIPFDAHKIAQEIMT